MINATSQIGNPASKLVRQGTHLSAQTCSQELLLLRGEDFMVSTIIISQKPHKHLSDTNFWQGVWS